MRSAVCGSLEPHFSFVVIGLFFISRMPSAVIVGLSHFHYASTAYATGCQRHCCCACMWAKAFSDRFAVSISVYWSLRYVLFEC